VRDLLEKRDALERAIGMPVGDMLGCGHYGCVFRSQGPWVVKLTVDPTEGPIWSNIVELLDEEPWGVGGFSRVKKIVRLTPDVGAGRRKRRLYAIVREECEPAFTLVVDRAYPTEQTAEVLGLPYDELKEEWSIDDLKSAPDDDNGQGYELRMRLMEDYGYDEDYAWSAQRNLWDLRSTLDGLNEYSWAANTLVEAQQGKGLERHFVESTVEEARACMEQMRGWVGEPLRRSLQLLAFNGIYLRDVHELNIGWRVHETIDGSRQPECLVIFDPGHTPTAERPEIEERMIANARWGF
jgi:hypothetical protein